MSTEELARVWAAAQHAVKERRRQLLEAEQDLSVHATALGRHIAPKDMKIGEEICCWVRFARQQERIVAVTLVEADYAKGTAKYSVRFRGEPKTYDDESAVSVALPVEARVEDKLPTPEKAEKLEK